VAGQQTEGRRIKKPTYGQNPATCTKKLRKITNHQLLAGQTIHKEK
jgi:hypothetical protein